jgi:prevent-host-death family protein
MKLVNIQAAKTHLSRLVDEVVDGEEVVLAKAGKPLVRLVPLVEAQAPREMGLFAGEVWEAADCWIADDSSLDAAIESPLIEGLVAEPPPSAKP